MTRDREDFRADYGDGSEPEAEFDDREQADPPEDDDEVETIGQLASRREVLADRIDSLSERIQELEEKRALLVDELDELDEKLNEAEEG